MARATTLPTVCTQWNPTLLLYTIPSLASVSNPEQVYLISLSLGWDSFSLLSHSMGGSIAVMFAGAMPGLVQSLIVVESLGKSVF